MGKSNDTEIDGILKTFTEAFNSGNVEAMLELYTEDCVFLSIDVGLTSGIAEMQKLLEKLLKKHDMINWAPVRRDISGNHTGALCTEAGNMSLRQRSSEVNSSVEQWDHGNYLCTYTKGEDKKWRVLYDVGLLR